MTSLRFIFWDQLSHSISSLKNIHPDDIVLMCELRDEITNISHHPKKIALWFAAMRHFAEELRSNGINVRYIDFNHPLNTHNLTKEVERAVNDHSVNKIIVTEPSEYKLQEVVKS